jgi:hypothetical protein
MNDQSEAQTATEAFWRKQIADEIANAMYVLMPNCTFEEAMFIRDQAAKIARGE